MKMSLHIILRGSYLIFEGILEKYSQYFSKYSLCHYASTEDYFWPFSYLFSHIRQFSI